nr:HAMP domain-containing sensor histidine kinase [Sphingomonas sp. CROZ-RG-20F-R02-07]
MAYRRGWRAVACAIGLVGCGIAAGAAWRGGLWGTLTGAVLVAVWLATLTWWLVVQHGLAPTLTSEAPRNAAADRLVLDAAPTPMVLIEGVNVRALNRAARRLFAADDRVVPAPGALIRSEDQYLRYEGRHYRIDRVTLGGAATERSVAALIDIEQEERVAEARATAEMIHVLGHELLNGLAPIVSLAESGEAALDRPDLDPALLREIMATLARRAEGLQRFTEGYRGLARLPVPRRTPTSLSGMADDLARLFNGRWPQIALTVQAADGPDWPLDHDQFHQALWAILQNAAEAATARRDQAACVMLTIRFGEDEMIAEVQDSGAGVEPEQATRIFRPFHTTKAEGTGIGLSLARQIALAHGGALDLLPLPPTTFRLTIPLHSA